jgi:hypothetical protein
MIKVPALILIAGFLILNSCGRNKNQFSSNSKEINSPKDDPNTKLLIVQDLFNAILDTIKIKPIDTKTLIKSIWKFQAFENCVYTLSFNENGTGKKFHCELGYFMDIHFKILNDTLIIQEFDTPTEDNPDLKKIKVAESKYLFNGTALIMIGSKSFNMIGTPSISETKTVIEYKRK